MSKEKVRRTRERLIAFYVSEEERDMIIFAAQMKDMSISDFCRKTLMREAENYDQLLQKDGA